MNSDESMEIIEEATAVTNKLIDNDQQDSETVEIPINEVEPSKELSQEPIKEEPILNYWQLITQGNFEIALNYRIVSLDAIGSNGFGLIHYLVTYNNLEGLKLIIQMGADINVLSNNKQSAFMIACNYGYIEIAKLLMSHGCRLDDSDQFQFSALFYSIKQKHYALVFYLVTKLRFQNLVDSNGCSIIHWIAYQNDVNLLRFFKATSIEFDLLDKNGYSPLARACHSNAYEAAHHLVNTYPDMMDFAFDTKESKSLMRITSSALLYAKFKQLINKSNWKDYEKYHQTILAVFYVIITIMELVAYMASDATSQLHRNYMGLMMSMSYVMTYIFFLLYSNWFIFKTTNDQTQGQNILKRKRPTQKTTEEAEMMLPVKQPAPIVEKNKKQKPPKAPEQQPMMGMELEIPMMKPQSENIQIDIQDSSSSEEEIVPIQPKPLVNLYDFEKYPKFLSGITLKDFLSVNYKVVEEFIDQMHNKPPQYFKFTATIGQHKEEINALLEINDPLWYTGFTIIHLVYFLFETDRFRAIHNIDWNRICFTCLTYKSPKTFHCSACKQCVKDFHFHSRFLGKCINSTNHMFYFIFLVCQAIIVNMFIIFSWYNYYGQVSIVALPIYTIAFMLQSNTYCAVVYVLNLMVASYLNIFVGIEILLITFNMTYNELMNSQRYRYLFEPILTKQNKVYLGWATRFPNGILKNYFTYLVNQGRNLRLV